MKYRNKPVEVEAITFDELMKHGRDSGAEVINGMPQSFGYWAYSVTHENDECYMLFNQRESLYFQPTDMLIIGGEGLSVTPAVAFLSRFEAVS